MRIVLNRSMLAALLVLILAAPALASDGVLEINQTCALQTGCFPGDTAGWPVTITAPGSYRLTSNLSRTLPIGGSQTTDFIEISAEDVSVDLSGFRIACRNLLGAACTGTGSGVATTSSTVFGASVRNGSIVGMAQSGVVLGLQAKVTNLRVRLNRENGIDVGSSSTVSGNTAHENGNDGIVASVSTISGNVATLNGGDGIETFLGCSVQGNAVQFNQGFGLNLRNETGYRENVISSNTGGQVNGGADAGANVINGVVTPTP